MTCIFLVSLFTWYLNASFLQMSPQIGSGSSRDVPHGLMNKTNQSVGTTVCRKNHAFLLLYLTDPNSTMSSGYNESLPGTATSSGTQRTLPGHCFHLFPNNLQCPSLHGMIMYTQESLKTFSRVREKST